MGTTIETFGAGHTVGSSPVGWSPMWAIESMQHVVTEVPGCSDGRALVLSGINQTNNRRLLAWTDLGLHRIVDIRCRFMHDGTDDAGTNGFRVFGRVDPASVDGAETGAFIEIVHSHQQDAIGRYADTLSVQYYSAGSVQAAGLRTGLELSNRNIWYVYRLYLIDDHFRAKIWIEGQPEPADWMIDTIWSAGTGPLPLDGYVGVGAWQHMPYIIDSISVGYAGDLAPELPPLGAIPPDRDIPASPPYGSVKLEEFLANTYRASWDPVPNVDGYTVFLTSALNGIGSMIGSTTDTELIFTLDPATSQVGRYIEIRVKGYRLT